VKEVILVSGLAPLRSEHSCF